MAGAGVPVGGVSQIAFFAMKPRVDPCARWIGEILAEIVRLLPTSGFGEPKGPGDRIELRGWFGAGEGGASEVVGGHKLTSTRFPRQGKREYTAMPICPGKYTDINFLNKNGRFCD